MIMRALLLSLALAAAPGPARAAATDAFLAAEAVPVRAHSSPLPADAASPA